MEGVGFFVNVAGCDWLGYGHPLTRKSCAQVGEHLACLWLFQPALLFFFFWTFWRNAWWVNFHSPNSFFQWDLAGGWARCIRILVLSSLFIHAISKPLRDGSFSCLLHPPVENYNEQDAFGYLCSKSSSLPCQKLYSALLFFFKFIFFVWSCKGNIRNFL